MVNKQELIDIMREGWQPSGYYSVNFNANMVADKILERVNKELEILDIFKSLGFELQTTILGNNLFFSTYLKSALLTEEQYTKLKEWSEQNELDISHRKLTDDELDILYKIYSFKWE